MQTLIHVRFSPDGTVTEIGARPEGVLAQAWFDHLSRTAGSGYQALAGGRGIFRVEHEQLDGIKAALPK
jgi:hypothetical protein